MPSEKNVTIVAKMVAITPAQEKLLQFVSTTDPKVLKKAVRRTKENVLYLSSSELDEKDRNSCYILGLLEKTISKIQKEFKTS